MIITRRKIAAPVILLLLAAAAVSFVISLTFGSVAYDAIDVWDVVAAHIGIIPGDDVFGSTIDSVVWSLRAPRGLLALIVGAGLALAGVVMQTLVRNPLADPYLLGVSSGASVGATAVITIGVFTSFGLYSISVGALFGALAATAIVYLITLAQGGLTPLRLILTGVVASSAFSALASFLVFKAQDARAAQGVMFWMLGSVVGAQWDRLLLPALVVLQSTRRHGGRARHCRCPRRQCGAASANPVFHPGALGGRHGGRGRWHRVRGVSHSPPGPHHGGLPASQAAAHRHGIGRGVYGVGRCDRPHRGTTAGNPLGCGHRRARCPTLPAAHGTRTLPIWGQLNEPHGNHSGFRRNRKHHYCS